MFSKQAQKTFRIVNLSPDSFSGDAFADVDRALAAARAFPLDVLDIGAASTRPGAGQINSQQEFDLLERFFDNYNLDNELSLDCFNPLVIEKIINKKIPHLKYLNDVSGAQNPLILELISHTDLQIVSMHRKGSIPPTLKAEEISDNFYDEDGGLFEHMKNFWYQTLELAKQYGIAKERIILDPGLGFGKNLKQSLEIIDLVPKLKEEFGLPVLIGASRKSFLRLWKTQESFNNTVLDDLTKEYNSLFNDVWLRIHIC